MIQYSNISLLSTPSDDSHVITVGYGRATYAAKVHVHAISDVTGLADALSARVTSESLSTILADYVTDTDLTTTLADYATTAALTNYLTVTEFSTTIAGYVTATALAEELSYYATTQDVEYYVGTQLAHYSVVGHQHTVEPVNAVPVSGIITLERTKTQYKKEVTANTVIGFDATALGLGASDAATFELLIKMGTYTRQVLFGSTVRWLNGEEPLFNTPNTSYLCAFRTYDGGASWVGSYEGQF